MPKEKFKAKSNARKNMAKYLEACVEALDFSGSVMVHKKEKLYVLDGFGKADREHDVDNQSYTIFRLASVSKQFTAMAVMILFEHKALQLTDKIGKFLTKIPDKWKPITIHHLLTHTAGLPNYTELPEIMEAQRDPTTPAEIVERLKKFPMQFVPGKAANYTDSGYTMLGHIIELVAEQLYGDFLEEHVFQPLLMYNTGYDIPQMIIPNRARGYVRRDKNIIFNAPYLDMSVPHAAGALCSTVEDLFLWDRALESNKIISKKTTEIMFRPVRDVYACGWMIDELHGRLRIQHAGGIDGFTTAIMRFPEEDACVAVLCNAESKYFNAFPVAEDLASILFHEDVNYPRTKK